MYVCTNCAWQGKENKLTKQLEGAMWDGKCPICGDEVKLTYSVKNEEEKVEDFIEPKKKLDKMTKDELNDYAAKNLPNLKINYWWKKKKMLHKVKNELGEQ